MNRVTKIMLLLAMSVTLSGLSIGCNTMEGAGKDIEKTGDNIKDAAK